MYRDGPTEKEHFYVPAHIVEVEKDMQEGFAHYFGSFLTSKTATQNDGEQNETNPLQLAESDYHNEQSKYDEFLDLDALEEYEYDPNAFKGDIKKQCPIVRRCINSPAKVMDNYRRAFNYAKGVELLSTTTNIVEFAHEYIQTFDGLGYEQIANWADLNLSHLDTDEFTVYGVIGGGIRSHFLYQLYPIAFPNRGQNAIWAYYFLSGRKDYGFEDGAEFLMIERNGTGTQQNYFYPYDLFTYYGLKLYVQLKAAMQKYDFHLNDNFRYVYLNAFLDFIANTHREDINYLKPQYDELYY